MEAFSIFKENIEPQWEDKENQFGGEFSVLFPSIEAPDVDSTWEKLVFSIIGNTFPFLSEVI